MRPNPQETVIWLHLLKKSLMENFIFCAVHSFLESIKYSENSENLLLALRNNSFDEIMDCNIASSA